MKENTVPLVSVLVPVYNVEKYIGRCLNSLFSNTIAKKCEFIIVDDCSPDGSMDIVRKIISEFPAVAGNVVLRSHDFNRGLAAARNTALLQAHGKYIICVDSDDWVEPNYLECLSLEAERSGADIVGCNLIREEQRGAIQKELIFPELEDCVPQLLTGKLQGWLWQKMFRRSLITEHNIEWVDGLDMCEDLLFSIKVFSHAKKISFVPEYLYHYNCQNQNSLTSNLSDKKIQQILDVNEKVEEFLVINGQIDEYKDELLQRKAFTKIWCCLDANKIRRKYFKMYITKQNRGGDYTKFMG